MLSFAQFMMFALFAATIALVVVAELVPHLPTKRAAALASIATVTAALGFLWRDPPRGGDWPTMSWTYTGKTAKPKQRTAYVRAGEDEAGDEAETRIVEEPGGAAISTGDSAAERLETAFVAAFRSIPPPGPAAGDTERDCGHCPELVTIPAGDAVVGADPGDAAATPAEHPRRTVKHWPGFLMSRAEVSAAEYAAFVRATGRAKADCDGAGVATGIAATGGAATCVTAADAVAYAGWLTRTTGKTYRLPSESEWEYVARAGEAVGSGAGLRTGLVPASTAAADGPGGEHRHPWSVVGLGGGVAEITADCWTADLSRLPSNGGAVEQHGSCPSRVLRDGAEGELSLWRRPSARRPLAAGVASPGIGFRVVREAGRIAKR